MDIVRALGPYVCSVPELSGFCLELYNLMLGFADPDQFDLVRNIKCLEIFKEN